MQASLESPLFGVVSRLYEQKGLDLLLEILPQLMAESHANFAILGSGDSGQEEAIRELSLSYPDRIGSMIGFDGLTEEFLADPIFLSCPVVLNPVDLPNSMRCVMDRSPLPEKPEGSPIQLGQYQGPSLLQMDFFSLRQLVLNYGTQLRKPFCL